MAVVVVLTIVAGSACTPDGGATGSAPAADPVASTLDATGLSTTVPTSSSTSTSTTTSSSITAAESSSSGSGSSSEAGAEDGTAPATRTTDGFRCEVVERGEAGNVERVELIETSGLAASQRHAGVLWATNDSGQRSGVYAIDRAGGDLGFFALTDTGAEIDTVDVEDLALTGDTLYLADIGDNGARRGTVAVHAVAEPTPGTDGSATVLGTIEIQYPDGPTDAEALIVDPVAAELIILSKDLDDPSAPTRLYTAPLQATDGDVVTATAAGSLDVTALTAASDGFSFQTLLFPGSVTGADLSPGGDLIAIRTYGSVWFFPRGAGQSVTEALTTNEPCEVGSAPEAQGEAVAFLASSPDTGTQPGTTTVGYVTVSEGDNPPVNVAAVQVSD